MNRPEHKVKRACFKWSIGRELYTAPRIWVYAQNRDGSKNCEIKQGNNGKPQCYDTFSVVSVTIENHVIEQLEIRNDSTGQIVFQWCSPRFARRVAEDTGEEPTQAQLVELSGLIEELAKARDVQNDVVIKALMESSAMRHVCKDANIRTAAQASTAIEQLRIWSSKRGEES